MRRATEVGAESRHPDQKHTDEGDQSSKEEFR